MIPEKTQEDFYNEDDTRWFKTGDIGEVDEDGVFRYLINLSSISFSIILNLSDLEA